MSPRGVAYLAPQTFPQKMMTAQTIPVADLNDFRSDDTARRDRFIATIGEALEDIGFFALINHGVDADIIRRAYAAAEAFFLQPTADKERYEDLALKGQRGFTSFGREHAKDHDAPDLKEFWHVGREFEAGQPNPSNLPANLWPKEITDFQPAMLELYRQLDLCADSLLEACSVYLGEPALSLPDMTTLGDTVLRVIHYPPMPADAHPSAVRAAAHEDINFITLLCESTDEGLELLERDGSWRPIHALDGQIIVDSGDMIQRLTNGRFKSTRHRVANPSNDRSRRFSMPFFVHPRHEVDLTPLQSCVDATGGKAEYEPTTAGAFLLQRLREIGLA